MKSTWITFKAMPLTVQLSIIFLLCLYAVIVFFSPQFAVFIAGAAAVFRIVWHFFT